ncbi:hypothetical protein N9R34_02745, partial [Candidatus Thioglobus sp.]|nr:hypothetical protein [Candidatus Thioglobus sp.]
SFSLSRAPFYSSTAIISLATIDDTPYQNMKKFKFRDDLTGGDSVTLQALNPSFILITSKGKTIEESTQHLQNKYSVIKAESDLLYQNKNNHYLNKLENAVKKSDGYLRYLKLIEPIISSSDDVSREFLLYQSQIYFNEQLKSLNAEKELSQLKYDPVVQSYKQISLLNLTHEKKGQNTKFSLLFSFLMGLLLSASIILIKEFLITHEDN